MERVQLNGADIEYDVRGSGEPVVDITAFEADYPYNSRPVRLRNAVA